MKKLLMIILVSSLLIATIKPLFKILNENKYIISKGDYWIEANYGNVTAYSGNTKNTSKYNQFRGLIDGRPATQVTVGNQAIKCEANEITATATSNYQKAIDIYVWIAENVKYSKNTYGVKDPAIYAFEKRESVCTGFAGLYSAMCRDVGLSVRQLGGVANGSPHTWNQVLINGKWINVDCTFASSLFVATNKSKVNMTEGEAYEALTTNSSNEISNNSTIYTFGNVDYFGSSSFMKNRKTQYLIYQYNN